MNDRSVINEEPDREDEESQQTQESCHKKSRKYPLKSRRVVVELDTDDKGASPIREREEKSEDEDDGVEERSDTEQRWNQCGEDRVTNTSVLDDI